MRVILSAICPASAMSDIVIVLCDVALNNWMYRRAVGAGTPATSSTHRSRRNAAIWSVDEGPLPRSEGARKAGRQEARFMSLGRMPEGPQPLMRRDEAIQVPSPIAIWVRGCAVYHHLQDAQQSLRHFEVALIAGVVKWDQDLVEQPPPGVSRRLRRVIVAWDWLIV